MYDIVALGEFSRHENVSDFCGERATVQRYASGFTSVTSHENDFVSAVYSTCDMSILAFTLQEGSLTGISKFTSQKISLWYVPPSFRICSSVKPQPERVQVILFSRRRSISVFARRLSCSWRYMAQVGWV